MPKFFVKDEQINNQEIQIQGTDVNHIKNVLREKIGSELTICNEKTGQDYLCEIKEIKEENIICNIKEKLLNNVESNIKVTIMQGLPKADKMELIIQKSVELGVNNIIPIEMKRCVVKLKDKDKIKKIERWQKISVVAAKQSGRNIIPGINQVENLKNICETFENYDIVLLAYENEKENTLKSELKALKEKIKNKSEDVKIAVLVGPEGGIAEEEVKMARQKGAKVITLGKRILRTETVALNVLSIIMYELEN